MDNSTSLSFEFFPAKTDAGIQRLAATMQDLKVYVPEYCSVTFGAGGSDQANTKIAVEHALQANISPITPHTPS